MDINNLLNDIECKKVRYENVAKQCRVTGDKANAKFAAGIVSGLSFAEQIIKEHRDYGKEE